MTKKFYYTLLLSTLCLAAASCNDFLTSKDMDKMIPKTATHFKELIYGEMINTSDDWTSITDIMADYVGMETVGGTALSQTQVYSYYTWQQTPEYDMEGEVFKDRRFETLYADVLLCNSIESLLPDVTDDLQLVERLYGEIYFLRAHRYYLLAGLYGYPYVDEQSSQTTPCVPNNDLVGVDNVQLPRATQRVIYDIMERDIEQAIKRFSSADYPETIFRPGLRAARVLATRIYLDQKKYDKVIEHANALDAEYGKLYDLSTLYQLNGEEQIYDISGESKKSTFFNRANSEILYSYGSYDAMPFYASFTLVPTRKLTTKAILALYEPDDLRAKIFFDYWTQPAKSSKTDQTINANCIRLSEALMNRAEAYLMTGRKELAFADMQTIRNSRFSGKTAPALPSTGDGLATLKVERMREFCFEGQRWFDLRRWGCPEITHRYVDAQNRRYDYTLKANDISYTLPLPMDETKYNHVIENIPREQRNGVPASND